MGLFGKKKDQKNIFEKQMESEMKRQLKIIEPDLRDGEIVKEVLIGKKDNKITKPQIAVATDRRVFFRSQNTLTSVDKKSINYENIHSINSTSKWGATIEIIGSNNEIVIEHAWVNKSDNFVHFVEKSIEKRKVTGKNTIINNIQNPAAQLKEFKELLDMDIITQEEFDQKKKELLS